MKNPISATLSGLYDVRRGGRDVPALRPDERLDGRVALVTGANRGLGKAIATELAKRGAEVIMACRSGIPDAGDEVKRASGSGRVSMRALDLADLRDVARFCDDLGKEGHVLDLLVLNAGVVCREARATPQGFEQMFAVNFLANVLFVERLLAHHVIPTRTSQGRPRVVFVSSESHRDAGPIDLVNLGRLQPYGAFGSIKVYGYTKLLLSAYAAELARRLGAHAGVYACCPGAVHTDIAREAPVWIKPLLGRVMERFFRAPEAAAEPVTYLSCARVLEGVTGTYLHAMKEKPPSRDALDPVTCARLVRESEALIVRALLEPMRGAA